MINKKNLAAIRKEMELFDSSREEIIKLSRDILKDSKKAIFSLHRDDIREAQELLDDAKKTKSKVESIISKDAALRSVGAFSEALQEYSEAMCYLNFIRGKELPSTAEIGVDAEDYLMGVCDFIGELLRKAVNSCIKGDCHKAIEIKDFVSDLYSELMDFNFRSGLLRKKFDFIKYNLGKLEDLVLELKLKGKA